MNHQTVRQFQRKTLTKDRDIDSLLFGFLPTGHAAGVQASVGAQQLRDGQNIVEQHVCSVFQEPFGGRAGVIDLKVEREENLCVIGLFIWKIFNLTFDSRIPIGAKYNHKFFSLVHSVTVTLVL